MITVFFSRSYLQLCGKMVAHKNYAVDKRDYLFRQISQSSKKYALKPDIKRFENMNCVRNQKTQWNGEEKKQCMEFMRPHKT